MANKEMQSLAITQASEDDFFDLAKLKALDDTEATGSSISLEKAFDKLLSIYSDRIQIWLARCSNEAVGYWIGGEHGMCGFISYGIFVKKEFRRKGIGEKLKRSQVDYARQTGCKGIVSSTQNEHAKRILEKIGFKYVAESGVHYLSFIDESKP